MHAADIGCYSESEIFFYTPCDQARQTFFYPICAGHFFCNSNYQVQRNRYDSFLLMYIKKGAGYLTTNGLTCPFHEGDMVSVDCYQPHVYGTTKDSEILWVHFDGSTSREYVQTLHALSGPVCSFKNAITIEKEFQNILASMRRQEYMNDALCSCSIVRILTEALLCKENKKTQNPSSRLIDDTLSYISNHICEELPLQLLADRVGLSPFYFTRLFKKETGCTPHNYILQNRINIAKFYLKSSSNSVKEICFISGFPTESSFCTTFKKFCGMTPSEYRTQCTADTLADR